MAVPLFSVYARAMRTRLLGKTGLGVSELSLGTWGLSGDGYGAVTEEEQVKVMERAVALGITTIETAGVYARGDMEKQIGEHFGKNPAVTVITKIGTDRSESPPRKRFDPKFLAESMDHCRRRLQRDVLDVVLLHNPAATTVDRGEATGFLAEEQARGRIRAWGVAAGSVPVARAALEKGAGVLSLAYNALFSADVKALHDDIVKHGTGVLARSVLGHGLLCGYWSLYKEFPSKDHRAERWTPDELRRRISQLSPLRSAFGGEITTQRAVALRYVLSNQDVSTAVIGPRSSLQLDQLVREAGKGPPYLTEQQLEGLHFRLGQLGATT
jgi:aryl-alcohol dehydrogenase-like predicted oxidoreductase